MAGRTVPSGVYRNAPGVVAPGTGLPNATARKTMSTKQSAALEADETAQNRAQAGQFSFDVDAPGLIQVTNESYENPEEH